MTREELNKLIMQACERTWNEKTCKEIEQALSQEPCTDAVNREAVLDGIDVKAWEFCDYLISKGRNDEQKPVSHFADNLREYIRDELPPVTQKSGKWLITHLSHMAYCSECDFLFKDIPASMVEHFKYCPNCGKRMDDPQESEDTE